MELFVHSTTRNAPYVHQRLDSIVELWRAFLIWFFTSEKNQGLSRLGSNFACHLVHVSLIIIEPLHVISNYVAF